jgi:hypothetical protein
VPLEPAESGLGGSRPAAVALDCEMVDVLCDDGFPRGAAARVCVVDEAERVLLHSLIKPSRQVVDYKFEFTGARLYSCSCSILNASTACLSNHAPMLTT